MARKFDEYKHISYKSIQKLFWNKFAYKVQLRDGLEAPKWVSGWAYMKDPVELELWKTYQQDRRQFYANCRGSCPRKPDTWKSMWNGLSYIFFFTNEADAKSFIRKHNHLVYAVFRPESEAQVDALKQDCIGSKLVLRDSLYYPTDKFVGYRHCVEFHTQYVKTEEEELDNMVRFIFNEKKNARRYMYLYSKSRRLYLTHEKDIVHIKLALYEKIKRQTKVILKSEI